MAAKPVRISLDATLLERIDRDPQTKQQGRSAFIRDAVELYLSTKCRRDIDRQIADAYRTADDELQVAAAEWASEQAWPNPRS